VARTITVHAGVTDLDMQKDVWSRWLDWTGMPGNDYHTLAMRKSGYDPIPGGRSGLIYFLYNGWKLVYNPSTVRVKGVLYSDDFETAFWGFDGSPVYPATVSALVNSAVSVQNVVTGTALTAEQTAAAVWGATTRTLTALGLTPEQIAAAILAAAQATPLHADTKKMNGATVLGDGTVGNKWRG
jgi:hypothetical protein